VNLVASLACIDIYWIGPNPFARKSDGQHYPARRVDPEKIIKQNDSFFDKVDGNVRKGVTRLVLFLIGH
jgi:hypothetical protein